MITDLREFLSGTVIPLNTVTVTVPATPYPHLGVVKIQYAAASGDVQKTETGTLTTYETLPDELYTFAPKPKEQIESELSVIGWEFGAGYLYRWYERMSNYRHLYENLYDFADGKPFVDDSGINAADYRHQSEVYGVWQWEFNVVWKRGIAKPWQFESFRRNDPSLEDDGRRSTPFPGWQDMHPWLTTDEPKSGFESHYYFYRDPKMRLNKNTDVLPNGIGY